MTARSQIDPASNAHSAPRVRHVGGGELVEGLVDLSVRGLADMFRREDGIFVHTRLGREEAQPTGVSFRYSAIAALGLGTTELASQRSVLAGATVDEYCEQLVARLPGVENLGDVALVAWAAAERGVDGTGAALDVLEERLAREPNPYTVELAWALSAHAAAAPAHDTASRAAAIRETLVRAMNREAGVFAHWIDPRAATRTRYHVACFADQVYPIQALSRHHAAFGDGEALELAASCAARICELQGEHGQWWWHYDWRTGGVVEGYPVYTVHQDSMAPMALLDLLDAGGPDHAAEIRLGLDWMLRRPELPETELIDWERALVWRKIARSEPSKLTRKLRAGLTRLHPGLRLNALDRLLPPRTVDWESRPYHLGWILYAWLGRI